MTRPITWRLLVALLATSTAAAQPQLPARQRQDRRASLPATPSEPVPELYVAAGNLTTVAFNGPLDRDSLVVDRTRFKWVDVGDHVLTLEPFTDLGPGERLVMQVGFKDRALPAKAVLAVVSRGDVMDGKVEMDRRANSPEALLAALKQKEAEVEELKTRYAGNGPASLIFSGWLDQNTIKPAWLRQTDTPADAVGFVVIKTTGYEGAFSALVAVRLRNLPGQEPWELGQARLAGPDRLPVKVLSVQMRPTELSQGEEGLVVVEAQTPLWKAGKPFQLELIDASGQRRLSLTLVNK